MTVHGQPAAREQHRDASASRPFEIRIAATEAAPASQSPRSAEPLVVHRAVLPAGGGRPVWIKIASSGFGTPGAPVGLRAKAA